MTSTSDNIYSDANNTPPLAQAVPLGLQHVLAMFASNVTPSVIVSGAAGLAFGGAEPRTQRRSVSTRNMENIGYICCNSNCATPYHFKSNSS